MNIDIITKEILALCFMNANCLYSLSEEKLKLELFKGYEKYYLDLISHASKTRSPFNYEAYFVLNPNAMQLTIDSVSSSEDFNELLINFKAYHFRKSLKERTDKANELLDKGNHKDLTKAYTVLRQDIDLTNSTGVTKTLGELAENYDYTKPRNYIKVNYKALDGLNIENTDLVIIAGRPAMGKTALIINLLARMKKKGILFSLEMGDNQIMDRIVSYMSAGVPMEKIIENRLTELEREKVNNGIGLIKEWKSEIKSDTGFNLRDILFEMEKAVSRGCEYIMIDYLQLIRGQQSQNKNLEVGGITIALKEFAKKFKVPVILLSQLSRDVESRTVKRPILSDLRDSGRITACYTLSVNQRGLLKVS